MSLIGRGGRAALLAAATAGCWLGCNALAGIEEGMLGQAGSGGRETGSVDDGGGSDAEAGAVSLMNCSFPRAALAVRDLKAEPAGSRVFLAQGDGIPIAAINGNSQALVASFHNVAQDSGGPQRQLLRSRVDFDARNATPQDPPLPLVGRTGKARPDLQDGIYVMSAVQGTSLLTTDLQIDVLPFDGGNLLSYKVAIGISTGPNGSGLRSTFVAVGDGPNPDLYFVATIPTAVQGEYAFFAGRGSRANPATLLKSFGTVHSQEFDLFHVGTSIYVIDGGGPSPGAAAPNGYILPDNGNAVTLDPKPIRGPATNAQTLVLDLHDGVVDTSSVTFFGADVTFADATHLSLQLLSGSLSKADVASFTLKSPPLAASRVLKPAEIPISQGNHIRVGDEVVLVGGPGTNMSPFDGLNFLWLNAKGQTQFQASGDDRLLAGKKISAAGVSLGKRDTLGASFLVTWAEDVAPSGGVAEYEILYANDLQCSAKQ